MACLTSVASTLGFRRLFSTLQVLSKEHSWLSTDTWAYIAVAADELSSALEDEVSKAPSSLADVRPLTAEWTREGNEHMWTETLEHYDAAGLVGRLAVCDRVNRMAEVVDALERLRGVMDSVAADTTFNATDAIQSEVAMFEQNMERCDARHSVLLGKSFASFTLNAPRASRRSPTGTR